MTYRPCFVIWMSPQAPESIGHAAAEPAGCAWNEAPARLRDRLTADGWTDPAEALVRTPASLGEDDSLGVEIRTALVRLRVESRKPPVGLAVLFVWDGVGGDLSNFGTLIDRTEAMISEFDRIVAANIAAYPVLENRKMELLIRLPLKSTVAVDPSRQSWWTREIDRRLVRGTRRLSIERCWIQGPTNVTAERADGLTVADASEADAWTAEFLAAWVATDLAAGLAARQIPGERKRFGSVGVARRHWEPEPTRRYLSAQLGAGLLRKYLDAPTEKPAPEDSEKFLVSGVRPTTKHGGIVVRDIFDLLVHPTQMERTASDPGLEDLRNLLGVKFPVKGIDTEAKAISDTWKIPDTVMRAGQKSLAEAMYLAAVNVANLRSLLDAKVKRSLGEQVGVYLSDGRDTYILQTRARLGHWRDRLSAEDERVDEFVVDAFATANTRTGDFGSAIAELFQDADDPRSWVPEERPDPNAYADRLARLISERPMNAAVWARGVLAGTIVGCFVYAISQHVLHAMNRPPSPILGIVLGYLMLAGSLGWTWHAQRRRRAARRRALDSLYIAFGKLGRALLAEFLKNRMHDFYAVMRKRVGSDRADEASNADPDHLHLRLTRLANEVESSAERLANTSYAPRETDSPWNEPLFDPEALRRLPYQEHPNVFHAESTSRDRIAEVLRTQILSKRWLADLEYAELPETGLDTDISGWVDRTGFKYLDSISIDALADHLLDEKGAERVASEVRCASAPYYHLPQVGGASPDVAFHHSVPPEGEGMIRRALAEYVGELWKPSWNGPLGIAAFGFDGPVDSESLPHLAVAWPPIPEQDAQAPGETVEF